MQYTSFGPLDFKASRVALGTMTYGQQNTEDEAHEQLDYALERGINVIDTAELYAVPARAETQGKTEAYIGSWIRARGNRGEYMLATKIAGPAPFAQHIREDLGYGRKQLDEALGKSLDRLQTDYVDLYQLHWPDRNTNFFGKRGLHKIDAEWEDGCLGILENMDALIKEGKIRHWGLSNETPWGVMHFLHLADKHGLPKPISIQNPYSLLNRSFEVGLAEVCLRENIAGFPYSPLAMGRLSGKYLRGTDKPDDRLNQFKYFTRYNGDNALAATAAYAEIAERHGLSLTAMSLAFVYSRPFNHSTIIGATSMEQLKENIDAFDVELSKAALKEIETVQDRYPNPAV